MKTMTLPLGVLLANLVIAQGQTTFTVNLTPAENGGGTRQGSGSGTISRAENSLTLNISFSGLSSDPFDVHIHGPSGLFPESAPVLYNLNRLATVSGTSYTIRGTLNLAEGVGGFSVNQQLTQLNSGQWHINVHTATSPDGEIRGQILTLAAPTITAQPQSQTVTTGANVTFTVTATGTVPLSYEWLFNGAPISGATSSSLTLNNVQTSLAGNYSVRVSNSAGSLTSASARLTVNPPSGAPAITAQPQSQTVTAGANVTFTVTAAGTAPLRYEWLFNGAPIAGATSSSLALNNVQTSQAGNYSVRVSNTAGSVTSASARLTVNPQSTALTITASPQSQTVKAGANVTFTVLATSTQPLLYQWRFNGRDLAGATNPTLRLSNIQLFEVGNYSVRVNNAAGGVDSANAFLRIIPPPTRQIDFQVTDLKLREVSPGRYDVAPKIKVSGSVLSAPADWTLLVNGVEVADDEDDLEDGYVAFRPCGGPPCEDQFCALFSFSGKGEIIQTWAFPCSENAQNNCDCGISEEGWQIELAMKRSVPIPANAALSVIIDPTDLVAEFNESNNVFSTRLPPPTPGFIQPPTITAQPQSQTVTAGSTVTLNVQASGTPPLAYQWQRNGQRIAGATGPTLTLNNVQPVNAGSYTVLVSNSAETVPSATAILTVLTVSAQPPSITRPQQSQSVSVGANVTFAVEATGTQPLRYQWQKSGQDIPGATNATLALNNVQLSDGGSYAVNVTNPSGAVTSTAAILTASTQSAPLPFRLLITNLPPRLQIRLTVSGETGRVYRIEASTDLKTWTELTNLFQTQRETHWIDSRAADFAVRYYRATVRDAPSPVLPTGTFFNGPPVFSFLIESAANTSCCGGQPTASRGISRTAEQCYDCAAGGDYPGLAQATAGGHVFLHSGEVVYRGTFMSILGRAGLNWNFTLTRREGANLISPLGRNMEFSDNRRLFVETNGNVTRMDGHGRADKYVFTNGAYVAPKGFYTKLIRHADGTFTERDQHGTKVRYLQPDTQGLAPIREWIDSNGNRIQYNYNAQRQLTEVIDPMGRRVVYRYKPNRLLSELEDYTGRRLVFEHNTQSNLTAITIPRVPGDGDDFPKTTRFRYSLDASTGESKLEAVFRPNEVANNGPPCISIQYETNSTSPHRGRVLRFTLGGTNASGVAVGGTIQYSYRSLSAVAPTDFISPVSETTVFDRNGNRSEWLFNQIGNIVGIRQFSSGNTYETKYEYNSDGELVRKVLPEGNSIAYEYDRQNPDRFQQGNLLRVTRIPDATRGGGPSRITTFTYEPLFNQPGTITTPRGNDPSYVPQNGGTNSPARYTTTLTYDYQEAVTPPPEAADFGITIPRGILGLGDVNGDGRTDQADGNLVRREELIVNLLPNSNQARIEGGTRQSSITRIVYNDFGQPSQAQGPLGAIDKFIYYPETDPDGDGREPIPRRNPMTGGYLAKTIKDAIAGPIRRSLSQPAAITNSFAVNARGAVTSSTDGRGNTHRFRHNQLDQVVEEEAPKVHPSQTTGYLRRYYRDYNGNEIAVEIQNVTTNPTNHAPMVVTSHPFYRNTYVRDILNNLVEVKLDATLDPIVPATNSPASVITRYRYDANENLIQRISPLAVLGADPQNLQSFKFDSRNLLVAQTIGGNSADASTHTITYNRNGNRTAVTDAEDNDSEPGNESERTTYNGFDEPIEVTDRVGSQRRFKRDPDGRVIREEIWGRAGLKSTTIVLLSATSFLFDEKGRQVGIDRDLFIPVGVQVQRKVELTDGSLVPGDGKINERYEFDADDRPTFRIADSGETFQSVYDGARRLIAQILPLVDTKTPGGPYPSKIEYAHDASGNVVQVKETHTNPDGLRPPTVLTNLLVYDALSRPVRHTDPQGHTYYTEYNSREHIVAAYDARGPLVQDPLGLYPGSINQPGNANRFGYDGLGNPWLEVTELTTTGEGGTQIDKSNPYNPDGLIQRLTVFNANSLVTSKSDDLGFTTSFANNSKNWMVAQTNASGGVRTSKHDRDGNLIQMVDEDNTVHTYVYNGNGQIVSHTLKPDPSKTIPGTALPLIVGTTLQTFAYNGLSQLVSCFDNNYPNDPSDDWTVISAYDSVGRPLEEDQNGRLVSFGYKADDQTQLHYPSAGRVLQAQHDGLNHLTSLSDARRFSAQLNWFGTFPPIQISYGIPGAGNLVRREFTRDGNKQVTHILESAGQSKLAEHTITRNRSNDAVAIAHEVTGAFRETRAIGLDSANRQIAYRYEFADGAGSRSNFERRFFYNGAQDLRESRDESGKTAERMTFAPTHEPTANLLEHSRTGARIQDENFYLQYDGEGRLRAVSQRANSANRVALYSYDAQPSILGGRRVQKIVTNSGTLNGTTRYSYQGPHCIEESTVRAGEEKTVRQFIYGNGLDEPYAMDVDTNGDGAPDDLLFYLRDHNNNTTALVRTNGQLAELYTYDFRGKPTVREGRTGAVLTDSPSANPFLFTGQRYDTETGYYYYKARYFDPNLGVFLGPDPSGSWGDTANLGNPMAYVAQNPWNLRDPSGLQGTELILVLVSGKCSDLVKSGNCFATKEACEKGGSSYLYDPNKMKGKWCKLTYNCEPKYCEIEGRVCTKYRWEDYGSLKASEDEAKKLIAHVQERINTAYRVVGGLTYGTIFLYKGVKPPPRVAAYLAAAGLTIFLVDFVSMPVAISLWCNECLEYKNTSAVETYWCRKEECYTGQLVPGP